MKASFDKVQGLKPYLVTSGYDEGNPEDGPIWRKSEDIVYADSKESAEKFIDEYMGQPQSGYEGCWAREATSDEVEAYEAEMKRLDEEDKWLRDNGYIDDDYVQSSIILGGRVMYPCIMLGEFEDGYSTEMPGADIGDCLWKLDKLQDKHGELIWYSGLNDEDYVDGEYVGRENFIYESSDRIKSRMKYVKSSRNIWNELSGSEQMAVEYAVQKLENGYDIEDSARYGCNIVSEANSFDEYSSEGFYQEEPDLNKVVEYLESRYGDPKTINSSDDVRTFRNKQNQNKYLETKKYKDGHTVSRGYMKWDTPNGEVKNYMGSKSNRGRWHRMNQDTLKDVVQDDYEEIKASTDASSVADKYYNRVSWKELCNATGYDGPEEGPSTDEDYELDHVAWLLAKDEYYRPLAYNSYDIAELVSENGREFIAVQEANRVFDITDEVVYTFSGDELIDNEYD